MEAPLMHMHSCRCNIRQAFCEHVPRYVTNQLRGFRRLPELFVTMYITNQIRAQIIARHICATRMSISFSSRTTIARELA